MLDAPAIHFLALGRVGPIRTRWLAGWAHDARLRVELVVIGQGDRGWRVAVVRLARFPGYRRRRALGFPAS